MNGVVLELRQATKKYAGVPAIEAVDFTLQRGEIHAGPQFRITHSPFQRLPCRDRAFHVAPPLLCPAPASGYILAQRLLDCSGR